MIIDAFPFFNELDILEIRLRELDPVVDIFVLVEATQTFSGHDKPLYFQENAKRFEQWYHKIAPIVVCDMPPGEDHWIRDHYQKEQINRYVKRAGAGDFLIIGDVDEIPRASYVRAFCEASFCAKPEFEIATLQMSSYYYYLNYQRLLLDSFFPKILTGKKFHELGGFQAVRYSPLVHDQIIARSGWHFTYMGGVEKLVEKLKSFAHCDEAGTKELLDRLAGPKRPGENLWPHPTRVEIDHTFPAWVQANQELLTNRGLIAAGAGKS